MKIHFPRIALSLTALLVASAALQADLFVAPYGPGGTWKIYETVNSSQTWANAQANALTRVDPLMGTATTGNLVTIRSAAENNFVRNIVRGGGDWWAGGTDQTVEGEWRWISNGTQFWQGGSGGTAVGGNYANWNGGEPNNATAAGEHFLQFAASTGRWNDHLATQTFNYIVEYETGLTALPASAGAKVMDPSSGRYYEYIGTAQNWVNSKAIAESRSFLGVQGKLMEVNNAAESTFARSFSDSQYIGLNDDPFFSAGESANNPSSWAWTGPVDPATGNFTYRTVAAAGGFTFWGGGEPNGGTGENHGTLRSDYRWNDLNGLANSRNAMIEYDVAAAPANIKVKTVNGTGMGTGIGDIQNIFNGKATVTARAEGMYAAINHGDPQNPNGQRFAGYAPFPNDTLSDDNNFAYKAYATIVIPAAGDYTFGMMHDDQAQLVVDRGSQPAHVYTTAAQTGEHFTTVNFPAPGKYSLYLTFAEIGGGAQIELYSAAGVKTGYDSSFQLVGDTLNGGLSTDKVRDIWVREEFKVTDYKSTVAIAGPNYLASVDALMAGTNLASTKSGTFRLHNFFEPNGGGGNGNFGGDLDFVGSLPTVAEDNFATRSLATIVVPEEAAGWWTFGINGDDGGRLRIDGIDVIVDNTAHGPQDAFGSIFLTAGEHSLDLVFFELGGGAESELFYAAGRYTGFNSAFQLLEATSVPEPATMGLALLGLAGLGRYVRRRK